LTGGPLLRCRGSENHVKRRVVGLRLVVRKSVVEKINDLGREKRKNKRINFDKWKAKTRENLDSSLQAPYEARHSTRKKESRSWHIFCGWVQKKTVRGGRGNRDQKWTTAKQYTLVIGGKGH